MRVLGVTLGVLWLVTAPGGSTGALRHELSVLTDPASARRLLADSLNEAAFSLLAERHKRVAGIATRADLEQHQRSIRDNLLRAMGGLPERTPLNPQVTGILERDGYRVEKVIFESEPGFHVTANLYVPATGSAPYPGILVPLGHEQRAKAHVATQRLAITFAKNGFVVLVFEPLGQGERIQLYDAKTGTSKVEYATVEHTLAGTQCLLLGHSVARHFVWDAIRALDYLAARPEVDAARIGVTGNSGGGTTTAYLAVLDERVKAAAPSCYLTSWKRLLEAIGPQDAEQNLVPSLAEGLDLADFVIAAAPRPYLILSAVRDFFPIEGARSTFREAKRSYEMMGAGENLAMFESDDVHGYSDPRRAAAYRFMNRWLKGLDAAIEEPEVAPDGEKTLACTATGQVTTSLGGETIFSINRAAASTVTSGRAPVSTAAELGRFQAEVRSSIGRLAAIERPRAPLNVQDSGVTLRAGYRIEKLTFESEPGVVIPALVFVPDGTAQKRRAILYADDRGKAAQALPGGEIEKLVREGALVFALDVRGTGETREDETRAWAPFGHYKSAMTALLIGKTLVGQRAIDMVRAVDVLAARGDVEMSTLSAVGKGAAAVALLHAAVLDDRIKEVTLDRMLMSYASAFVWKMHRDVFQSVVPAALPSYDLPDLAASLAPRPVRIRNARNPRGARVRPSEVARQYEAAQKAYAAARAPDSLVIGTRKRRAGLEPARAGEPPERGSSPAPAATPTR